MAYSYGLQDDVALLALRCGPRVDRTPFFGSLGQMGLALVLDWTGLSFLFFLEATFVLACRSLEFLPFHRYSCVPARLSEAAFWRLYAAAINR